MLDGGVKERTMDRDGETKRPRDWEVEREPPKARISISYIIKYRPGGASQRELTSALICWQTGPVIADFNRRYWIAGVCYWRGTAPTRQLPTPVRVPAADFGRVLLQAVSPRLFTVLHLSPTLLRPCIPCHIYVSGKCSFNRLRTPANTLYGLKIERSMTLLCWRSARFSCSSAILLHNWTTLDCCTSSLRRDRFSTNTIYNVHLYGCLSSNLILYGETWFARSRPRTHGSRDTSLGDSPRRDVSFSR